MKPENPEKVEELKVQLEKEKDFYEKSLEDLDEEYAVGDIDEKNYDKLKVVYTKRLNRVVEGKPAPKSPVGTPFYKRGIFLLMVFILALGTLSGTVLAITSGQRSSSQEITGSVRESSVSLLQQANEAMKLAVQSKVSGSPNSSLFEIAITLYENVLAEDPVNLQALQAKSIAEQEVERPKAARKTIEAALAINPENITTLAQFASLERSQGFYNEALKYIERILSQNPSEKELTENSVRSIELLIYADRINNKYRELDLTDYPASLGGDLSAPTSISDLELPNAELAASLGILLAQANSVKAVSLAAIIWDVLIADLDQNFTSDKEKVDALVRHGVLFAHPQVFPADSVNNVKGYLSLERALDLAEEDVPILRARISLYRQAGKHDKALTDVNRAIADSPKLTELYFLKVQILDAIKDRAGVVETIAQITEMFPSNPRGHLFGAINARSIGNLEMATAEVSTSIDLYNKRIEDLMVLTQRSPNPTDTEQQQELANLRQELTTLTSERDEAIRLRDLIMQEYSDSSTTTTTTPTTATAPTTTTTTS